MILGMTTLTFLHVVISLVGIGSGFVVLGGFFAARRLEARNAIFLVSTEPARYRRLADLPKRWPATMIESLVSPRSARRRAK